MCLSCVATHVDGNLIFASHVDSSHHSVPHAAADDAGGKLGSCPCEPSCACTPSLPKHRIAVCQNHTMRFATASLYLGLKTVCGCPDEPKLCLWLHALALPVAAYTAAPGASLQQFVVMLAKHALFQALGGLAGDNKFFIT